MAVADAACLYGDRRRWTMLAATMTMPELSSAHTGSSWWRDTNSFRPESCSDAAAAADDDDAEADGDVDDEDDGDVKHAVDDLKQNKKCFRLWPI